MYTVKNLLESGEFLQLHLISGDSGINREIKGVHIITLADAEKCLTGGEILFTNLKVYEKMSKEKFLFHLEELNKKGISGFIIKRNKETQSDLFDMLLEYCEENRIPVLEISQNLNYWSIVKYILRQAFNLEISQELYFLFAYDLFSSVLLNESDLHVAIEKILFFAK